MTIKGYRRPDGRLGFRNYVLILPASVCATVACEKIAANVKGAVAIPNQDGCAQIGQDLELTKVVLTGFANNPNVGATLIVGLGCEGAQAKELYERIKPNGKPVEFFNSQEAGGTAQSIAKGTSIAQKFADMLSQQEKVEGGVEDIILGMECGGSDSTSGIASNPVIGYVSDKLVKMGATTFLSETTEVIGAEHILARRFPDGEREKFLKIVADCEQRAIDMGANLRDGQPSPGNKDGGLTTIEEKSLGCMYKAGKDAPFQGALNYAERVPDKHGLYFMDTPGYDIESNTGMVAGGANVIIFSTGRGTPSGTPITPVIKVTGNSYTYAKMGDDIDINAGKIITEGASLKDVGEEAFNFLIEVCNGRQSAAELLGHVEFGIWRIGPSF